MHSKIIQLLSAMVSSDFEIQASRHPRINPSCGFWISVSFRENQKSFRKRLVNASPYCRKRQSSVATNSQSRYTDLDQSVTQQTTHVEDRSRQDQENLRRRRKRRLQLRRLIANCRHYAAGHRILDPLRCPPFPLEVSGFPLPSFSAPTLHRCWFTGRQWRI